VIRWALGIAVVVLIALLVLGTRSGIS